MVHAFPRYPGRAIRCALVWILFAAPFHDARAQVVPAPILGGELPGVDEADKRQNTLIQFTPQTEELEAATDALREHLKKMREVVIRFNVSPDHAAASWKEKYNALVVEGSELHDRFIRAAIAEYRQNLETKQPIGEMLFKILERNIERDRYEGMVEVARTLIDGGYQHENLRGYLTMAAYALCQFEIVEPNLNKLIESGVVSQQLLRIRENLDQLKKDWAEELEYRRKDASGEPLPRALLRTTKGDIEVELFENQAPETVANFIFLAESGFYDHHLFHRVIQHFMAQTGDPNGDGTGGPGYTIYDESGRPDHRKFFRGSLGMAMTAEPNSGGSQFFITFLPTFDLNGQYTVFGRVTKGIEVLSNLRRVDPEAKDKKGDEDKDVPLDELIEVRILSKRDHEYLPHKVENVQ